MNISARTRREAILLLDVAASSPGFLLDEIRTWMNLGLSSWRLAHDARWATSMSEFGIMPEWNATAAGLLRDGWSPGDPVVRLQHGAKP